MSKSEIFGYKHDGTYQPIIIDGDTHSLVVIDIEHYMIHAQKHFFYTDSVTLGNAGTQEYLFPSHDTVNSYGKKNNIGEGLKNNERHTGREPNQENTHTKTFT